jgi:hypothetical protein
MPGIHRDLFSVGCFLDLGHSIKFIRDSCLIRDVPSEQIILRRTRLGKNGLYKLSVECLVNTKICTIENKAIQKHCYGTVG